MNQESVYEFDLNGYVIISAAIPEPPLRRLRAYWSERLTEHPLHDINFDWGEAWLFSEALVPGTCKVENSGQRRSGFARYLNNHSYFRRPPAPREITALPATPNHLACGAQTFSKAMLALRQQQWVTEPACAREHAPTGDQAKREPIRVKTIMQGPHGVLFVKNPRHERELPGGRLEPGESLETALACEVKEECGLDVTAAVYLGSGSCEVMPGRRVLRVVFPCELAGQDLTLSEEHTAHEWVVITASRPAVLPQFYWRFCQRLDARPAKRLPVVQPQQAISPSSPLYAGERDRQRLSITAAIYDSSTTDFFSRNRPNEGRILEVGCGHGQRARWMAANSPGATIVGLDLSQEQIGVARAAAQELAMSHLDFRVGDATELAGALSAQDAIDLITCRFTLRHLKGRDQTIQALMARLRLSGVLVIEEPSLTGLFSVPALTAFEEANAAILAYGRKNGVNYDCIKDVWSVVTRLDVEIKDARLSQPTVGSTKLKQVVCLFFQQFRPPLVECGLLDDRHAGAIAQSLAQEYVDERVISGRLRPLQPAISLRREQP